MPEIVTTRDERGAKFIHTLKSGPAYGGLDLSAVSDLTSFVCVWPVADVVNVYPWYFLPEEGLADRSRHDNVPYDQWAEAGYIELTPGPVVDWRYVTTRIKQLAEILDIRQIAFDRWGARDTASDLAEGGLVVIDTGQTYKDMSAPCKRLLELVLACKLIHTGHPVLRWNVDCTTVIQDPAGNIKPEKPDRLRGSKRIDGVVAMIMAIGAAAADNAVVLPLAEVW